MLATFPVSTVKEPDVIHEIRVEDSQIVERLKCKKQAKQVAAFQGRLNALGVERWEMVSFEFP